MIGNIMQIKSRYQSVQWGIEQFLRNMYRWKKSREKWTANVVLEPEEYTKYMDIIGMKLKDKRKDLQLIQSMREEIERLKVLNEKIQQTVMCRDQEIVCLNEDIDEYKEQVKDALDTNNMLDNVIDKLMNDKLDNKQYKKLMTYVLN